MNKRKNLIIILITLIIIIIIFTIMFLTNNNKFGDYKNLKVDVDVYKNVKISDLLDIDSEKLVSDFKVDTDSLGEKEIEFSYYDDNNKKINSSFVVNVVDQEPPYFRLGLAFIHVIGDEFDMLETLFCGDNYTVKPECYIIGDYNLNKVGDYPVVVRAEDESGNFREGNIVIKVVEKEEDAIEFAKQIGLIEFLLVIYKKEFLVVQL